MSRVYGHVDWVIIVIALILSSAGLITMHSFSGESPFFERQIVWLLVSLAIFFALSPIDFRFLRRPFVIVALWLTSLFVLGLVLLVGAVFQGAQSWFDLGAFALQPSDPVKLIVILVLAKYFSRRHIEIANIRHIFVSGAYVAGPLLLVFLQPDFGSAVIIASIWLGMVLVSGISKWHLALVGTFTALLGLFMWFFVFEPYQHDRIRTFLNPYTDIQGAGYNAYQSTIAVGSGQLLGKGIGYGTQSKLQFLPEHETDFIFAAFAEEWGFIGSLLLLSLFAILIFRIVRIARLGLSNFEVLYGAGVAILFMSHVVIHVGMNIGILPVTGTTIPFLSYGGTHLVTEFAALGILMGMRRYGRVVERDALTESVSVEVSGRA